MITGQSAPTLRPCVPHRGLHPVRVGAYEVYASGTQYLDPGHALGFEVLVTLNGLLPQGLTQFPGSPSTPLQFGEVVQLGSTKIIGGTLKDFGGTPPEWRSFLETLVIPELQAARTVLAFCTASHGRTGTFLASLVALLELPGATPDPIFAVRTRHCCHAVETLEQAKGVFALRSREVPKRYLHSVQDTHYKL